MKTMKFIKTMKGVAGLAITALILNGAPVLYAEETTGAITPSQKMHEVRKERFERFLENHPKIKEKLDVNQDGTVDREEFKQGKQQRKEKRQEKRENFLENHPELKDRLDRNDDGAVDKKEYRQAKQYRREHRKDRDNNPPGMAGGRGTNWENRPGPAGGPGASPDRRGGGHLGGRGGRK